MTDHKWGPWIEHDAALCLRVVPGQIVEFKFYFLGEILNNFEKVISEKSIRDYGEIRKKSYCLAAAGNQCIVRYRIRRPRALIELTSLIAGLPVNHKVDA